MWASANPCSAACTPGRMALGDFRSGANRVSTYSIDSWLNNSNLCRFDGAVRIENELSSCALIEILVALRGLFKWDHGDIDCLGWPRLFVQNRHHELAVITHDWTLTRSKGV